MDRWEQAEVSQLLSALRELRGMIAPSGGFARLFGGCCSCGSWLTVPAGGGGRNFDFHHVTPGTPPAWFPS